MFDRFAEKVASSVAKSWFFVACVLSVCVWAITGPFMEYSDTWQLIINTATTVLTFLLVALFQNSQKRFEAAMNAKIDELIRAIPEAKEVT